MSFLITTFYYLADENYLTSNILGHCWRVYDGYRNAEAAMRSQFPIQRHSLTSCFSQRNSRCPVKFIRKKEIFRMCHCMVYDTRVMASATYFCSTIFATNAKSSTLNTRPSRMTTCVIVCLSKKWREPIRMVEKYYPFWGQLFWYDGVIVEFMLRVQKNADSTEYIT